MGRKVCYFWCCFSTGLTAGDSITPRNNEVISTEGESVTLNCTYKTTYTQPRLYWYRHYPNQAPQFILYKGARSSSSEHIPDKRYQSTTSKTSTKLVIQQLTLSDTALYYCDGASALFPAPISLR
uniref:Ig-like domain-containing protein n=1 Tax=Esox lucius TaxID=8010 RepID=A0AAY5KY45_ESOLU